jgi:hypothetical protein
MNTTTKAPAVAPIAPPETTRQQRGVKVSLCCCCLAVTTLYEHMRSLNRSGCG